MENMENKINIAELLKDCPKGMELDCTVIDNCILEEILEKNLYPIKIKTPEGSMLLTQYGCFSLSAHAKCIIFPKGKTTWEGFHRPFEDGDIVACDDQETGIAQLFIVKRSVDDEQAHTYCFFDVDGTLDTNNYVPYVVERFATEEEKQKLFNAIKANGYEWNEETKTLEKLFEPKFKVGDIVQDKDGYKVKIFNVNIEDKCYGYESLVLNGIGGISFDRQDDWELVPNKFDINTLKPFDKVLVRISKACDWMPKFFSHYNTNTDLNKRLYPFVTTDNIDFPQCIPYNGNEYLCRTTNDCDDYYKTWK